MNTNMPDRLRPNLRALIEAQEWSERALSREAKLSPAAVTKIFANGLQHPRSDTLRKIARALNVTVAQLTGEAELPQEAFLPRGRRLITGDVHPAVGHSAYVATSREGGELRPANVERLHVKWVAEAGAWREADIYEDEPEAFSVIMSETHPGIPRFLVKVAGDSVVDLKIFDGDYVVCAEWIALEGRMSDGQVVVVQQTDGHRIETTIKVLKLFKDRYELQPRSPNPKHKPIVVHPGDGDSDGRNVEIIGLVESLHRPIGRG